MYTRTQNTAAAVGTGLDRLCVAHGALHGLVANRARRANLVKPDESVGAQGAVANTWRRRWTRE